MNTNSNDSGNYKADGLDSKVKSNYKKPFDRCLAYYQDEINKIWEEFHPKDTKDSYHYEGSGDQK
jgi:hypothetical protein